MPTNLNPLTNNGIRFWAKKLPNVNFFVKRVMIPGLSFASEPKYDNPFNAIPEAGDHLLYDELQVEFFVDEELKSWMELHKWMRGLGFPDDFDEFKDLAQNKPSSQLGEKADVVVEFLNSRKNLRHIFTFLNAFPVNISGFNQDNGEGSRDVPAVTCVAVFRYERFDIESINPSL